MHLLLDMANCNKNILDNLKLIRETMKFAAQQSGAQIMGETFHKFTPVGVTGIISIAESHVSIHTWPEFNYAAVDIFSCGKNFDIEKCVRIIAEALECTDLNRRKIKRGPH